MRDFRQILGALGLRSTIRLAAPFCKADAKRYYRSGVPEWALKGDSARVLSPTQTRNQCICSR
jgi:hypothetical protein